MALTSINFLIFCAILIPVYYIVPKKVQWMVLLAANIVFYMMNNTGLGIYIILTSLTSYVAALILQLQSVRCKEYIKNGGMSIKEKKAWKKKVKNQKRITVTFALVFNFGILAYMKYLGFFAGTIKRISGIAIDVPDIIVPLGISFYTFMAMGYVVDVYWGKVEPEKNFLKYVTFLSYFPHIMQGPIESYRNVKSKLFEVHTFSYEDYKQGILRILWGLFKKLVIADRIKRMVDMVFAHYQEYHPLVIAVGVIGYGIQVYADFAGYMDIAAGISQVLGIPLTENFRRPFLSRSVSEYWRRWHITLGAWFREYMFYPITLSKPAVELGKACRKRGWYRLGKLMPSYLALFFVWATTGLWHGASWRYVIWGLGNCFFIVVSMQLEPIYEKGKKWLSVKDTSKWFITFQIARTFILMGFLRLLSRADSFREALGMYKSMFVNWGNRIHGWQDVFVGLEIQDIVILAIGLLVFFCISILQELELDVKKLVVKRTVVHWTILLVLIYSVILLGEYGKNAMEGFIYGKF